jgi:hypothetical protein
MGAAAYKRGSNAIRQQVDDEQKRNGVFRNAEFLAYRDNLAAKQQEVDDLKAKLQRAEEALARRTAELHYERDLRHKQTTDLHARWMKMVRRFALLDLKHTKIGLMWRLAVKAEDTDYFRQEIEIYHPELMTRIAEAEAALNGGDDANR